MSKDETDTGGPTVPTPQTSRDHTPAPHTPAPNPRPRTSNAGHALPREALRGVRFSRLHKVVTYLVAGLGLLSLTFGRELQLPSIALIAVGYIGSWFAEGALLHKPGYTKFWNRLVVGVFGLQLVRAATGAPLLALGIEYAAFLQLSRLFHRCSARDHQHIAVLAFLHLIAATVLSTGLDYALVFVGFVIVTPWMLALTHLRAEIESHYGGSAQSGNDTEDDETDDRVAGRVPTEVQRVLSSRRVAGPGLLLGTAMLAIPLFALSTVLFVAFPRVGVGLLRFGSRTGQPTAGFGRNVQLGGFGVVRDDPTVVARVKVPNIDDPGRQRRFRLRGTSFDHYDGRQWTRTTEGSKGVPVMFGNYPIRRWPEPEEDQRLRILLDPLDEPVVFLPRGTVGLSMQPRVEGGKRVRRKLRRAPGLDIRYVGEDSRRIIYDAYVSDKAKGHWPGDMGPETRERYLQLPEGHERIADLAHRIVEESAPEAVQAEQLKRYLQDSGNFEYTLDQPDVRGRDPLEAFLFDARAGHCEYFSSAMAVMLRTVGIPSRNVSGFLGGKYNQYGRYYAIRQGDAHSWVEAYIDGRWVPFDPTPASRNAIGPGRGLLASVRDMIDALRVAWTNEVVDYNLRKQVEILRDLRKWFSWVQLEREPSEGAPPREQPPPSPTEDETPWSLFATAAAVLGALGLGGVWIWRRRRRGEPPRAADRHARQAVRLYRDLERQLARCGRPRPPDTTPLEHAQKLAADGFPASPTVDEITRAYLDVRYGGRALSPSEAQRLRSRIRAEVRAS